MMITKLKQIEYGGLELLPTESILNSNKRLFSLILQIFFQLIDLHLLYKSK